MARRTLRSRYGRGWKKRSRDSLRGVLASQARIPAHLLARYGHMAYAPVVSYHDTEVRQAPGYIALFNKITGEPIVEWHGADIDRAFKRRALDRRDLHSSAFDYATGKGIIVS